jgi:hypothetical protein
MVGVGKLFFVQFMIVVFLVRDWDAGLLQSLERGLIFFDSE